MHLRISGLLATLVFLVMAVSDLLMLTTLDFSPPYRFWMDAPGLSQEQVLVGYFLGVLTVPFYCVGAWHLALAVRPAPRWIGRLVLLESRRGRRLCHVDGSSVEP